MGDPMEKFKTGDLVALKSSPDEWMTVKCVINMRAAEATGREFGVHVAYFDALNGVVRTAVLLEDMLILKNDEEAN